MGKNNYQFKNIKIMNIQKFLALTMVAMMTLTQAPALSAAELTDSVKTEQTTSSMTVNGRPATKQEKAIAKQMTKQGVKMAKKGVQLAVATVTNPQKAQSIADEMEEMGEEMERLGDSLETMAEDTTFFYEGEDDDSLTYAEDDFEDLKQDIEEHFGWLNSWWGKLLAGGFGMLAGIFGILIAIFVVAIVFLVLTAPLWVIALVIWLLVRNSSKSHASYSSNMPHEPHKSYEPHAPYYQEENMEMWKSGIMYSCIGVGLILVFLSIGASSLWGIGALVAAIGVAKLVIATTTKGKKDATSETPQQESLTTGLGGEDKPESYNQKEN